MLTKSLHLCCTKFKHPRISTSSREELRDLLHDPSANNYRSFNSLFEPATTVSTSDYFETVIASSMLTESLSLSGSDCENKNFKSNNPLFNQVEEVKGFGSESELDMKAVWNSVSTPICLDDSETLIGSFSSSGSESDIAAAVARRRFFLASPGKTNSIVDSAAGTPESVASVLVAAETAASVASELVAVETSSSDPYADFRRSMEETTEALGLFDGGAHRRCGLQELLLCYLALNGKNVHAYIVDAFVDLLHRFDEAAEA